MFLFPFLVNLFSNIQNSTAIELPKYIKTIWDNKEWLFSGLGITILTVVFAAIGRFINKSKTSQSIKSGKNSSNFQAGKDNKINISPDKKDNKI